MADFQFDMKKLPLPPPWRYEIGGDGLKRFVNDATGEKTEEHPFLRAVGAAKSDDEMIGVKKALNSLKTDTMGIHGGDQTVYNTGSLAFSSASLDSVSEGEEGSVSDAKDKSSTVDLRALNFIEDELPNPQKKTKKVPFTDFRCQWKESSLFGDCNSYGLRIRHFDDQRTMVKIDGVDGEWTLTKLEGQYGPVDKYDLFVGGKVKVFGRWLTITSASASVCHGITVEAKRIAKMIAIMQSKVESVGSVPIIRRSVPTQVRHIVRSAQPEGHENLRKLLIDATKLSEQLCNLGLSHTVKDFSTASTFTGIATTQ